MLVYKPIPAGSLLKPKDKWFTDASSFVLNGEKKAGYAVGSHEEVIEA
jgi:hypothetical protein